MLFLMIKYRERQGCRVTDFIRFRTALQFYGMTGGNDI